MKLDRKLLLPAISLLLVTISVTYFWFVHNPPKITNLLTGTKEGVLEVQVPDQIAVNVPFEVKVLVDSKKQNVNAVGLYIRFNPLHLQILDFDTSNSFCQFYPEKKYENSTGLISLACGSPHPGFSGKNELISITFMPKLVLETNLQIDPKSQILLSNGKGTNILQEHQTVKLRIHNNL